MVTILLIQFGYNSGFPSNSYTYFVLPQNCFNYFTFSCSSKPQLAPIPNDIQQNSTDLKNKTLATINEGTQKKNHLSKREFLLKEGNENLDCIQNEGNYQTEINTVKSRNILPNTVNLILSFIRRVNKSGKIVNKIIQKNNNNRYSAKKFYSYQIYLKEAIKSYTSSDILRHIITFCDPSCTVFRLDEQLFYNMVCRSLITYYANQDGLLKLLASRKQLKTKRIDHLKVYRYILKDLKHFYRKEQSR